MGWRRLSNSNFYLKSWKISSKCEQIVKLLCKLTAYLWRVACPSSFGISYQLTNQVYNLCTFSLILFQPKQEMKLWKCSQIVKTRLSSIESQPKKVAVVVVVVVVVVVSDVVVFVVVVIILGQRNQTWKWGQKWVNDKRFIVVVVVVIVLVFLFFLIQTPSFKTWSKSGHYSWYVLFLFLLFLFCCFCFVVFVFVFVVVVVVSVFTVTIQS